jgi:hypothetical protein
MKTYIPYSLILAAASAGLAFGAETAYTTPVGYVSLGNAGAVPANTDMTLAIPLERPAVYAGAAAGFAADVLTVSGTPAFTVNQFTSSPHILKVESGAASGVIALITANTADSITVAFQNIDSFAGLVATDKISIRPAWTVKSFFAGNTIPDFSEFGVWEADWFDQADDSDANNIVIYPNEGFRLRNTSATAISNLVVAGEVPKAQSRVFVNGEAAQQDTRVSYFSPVTETIGTANIGAGNFDQLLAFDVTATGLDNAPAFTYYYFDGLWYDASDDSDVTNSVQIQPGRAYIYRSEAGRADTVLADTPAYVPSL